MSEPSLIATVRRNLNASPNSTKPIVTLTAFSHPPDFGIALSSDGKSEQRKNGAATVVLYAMRPSTDCATSPLSNLENMIARNGTEQENDVSASVTAMKKAPASPPDAPRSCDLSMRKL